MKKPKVSIIIPVYNGSNYIKEAIESALNQTYKNIEIIIINDGSNDNNKTKKICESYGSKIKYFEKENGGVSSALNYGIEKMTGDYFSWLSHDDVYYPNKIEKQMEYLINKNQLNKNIILYSNYTIIDSKSNKITDKIINYNEIVKKPKYLLLKAYINGITLLIPKKAFKDCGLFNENLYTLQDYDMWYRLSEKYQFIFMNEFLTCTRIHPKQTTNTSPIVEKEGSDFWIKNLQETDENEKKKLEGSIEKFYVEMYKFFVNTPYKEVVNYIKKEYYKEFNQELKIINSNNTTANIYSNNKLIRLYQIIKYEGLNSAIKRIIIKFKKKFKRK